MDIFSKMETLGNPTFAPKFECTICDYCTVRFDNFQKHLSTQKHKVSKSRHEKVGGVENCGYFCEKCYYTTSREIDYKRHLLSKKHLECKSRHLAKSREDFLIKDDGTSCENEVVTATNIIMDAPSTFCCEKCDRAFQTKSGLWKHKAKCVPINQTLTVQDVCKIVMETQQTVTSSQTKMMETMIEKVVTELYKNMPATYNNCTNNSNNINNITNNNTFNLNVFLNETCKDAMNLSDFIASVQVDFSDIEKIGNLGYVDGLSDVILRNLHEVGIERRPIHCTDAKRQTIYYKENNEWNKEDDNKSHLQYLIDSLQRTNLRQLQVWRDKYPSCLLSNSIHTDNYNRMSQELMGGDCKKHSISFKDHKIMSKIVKEIFIDKTLL
jgi:hypothetical protein